MAHWCFLGWQVLKPLVRSKLQGLASALVHAATAAHTGSGGDDSEDEELTLEAAQAATVKYVEELAASKPTAEADQEGSKPRAKKRAKKGESEPDQFRTE